MGCNCGRGIKSVYAQDPLDIKGGYKYLRPHQLQARLEIFKRNNCPSCETRFGCDYTMFLQCKVTPTVQG